MIARRNTHHFVPGRRRRADRNLEAEVQVELENQHAAESESPEPCRVLEFKRGQR